MVWPSTKGIVAWASNQIEPQTIPPISEGSWRLPNHNKYLAGERVSGEVLIG